MKFSPKQRRVLGWWYGADRERDAIICDGAVRSGKTVCLGLSFACWAMTQFSGRQFALCGKTALALRRNLLGELLPVLRRLGVKVEERRGERSLLLSWRGRENRFWLIGGRDEGSAALIQGATFAGALLDEAALMPRSFVEQCVARCSVAGSRLWFSCNPEGPGHWFYREWICRAEERNALYLHFTMADNPGLTEKVRRRYEQGWSGPFYRRFVLGEWTAAQGLVYDFFQEGDFVRPVPAGQPERCCLSIDYGTVNPFSCGMWGSFQGVWYRMKEYYYASRETGVQKTDQEYVEAVRTLAAGRPIEQVVVDPSAASFIEALGRAGFPVVKARNDVLSGIRLTAGALKSGRIVICDSCGDCLREMGLYCWEEGRERPKKENDHAMDDMRSFAATVAAGEPAAAALAVPRRSGWS